MASLKVNGVSLATSGKFSSLSPLYRLKCSRLKNKTSVKQQVLAQGEVVEKYVAALLESHPGWTVGLGANTFVFITGIKVLLNGLTWNGVLHSWMLGSTVFAAFGLGGYFLVCLYFVVGSLATKVKLKEKEAEGLAEKRSGRRSVGSVWGSGLAGVVCALCALTTGNHDLFQIGFVASFGSKLSDTVSSELGKAYGKTAFLATTFRVCPRGTEGAISVEGTLAGSLAAALYSVVAYLVGQISPSETAIVFAACIVANYVESVIGASIQGKVDWMTNDVVNAVQISIAAGIAIAIKQTLLSQI